jgi:hypothetical protein
MLLLTSPCCAYHTCDARVMCVRLCSEILAQLLINRTRREQDYALAVPSDCASARTACGLLLLAKFTEIPLPDYKRALQGGDISRNFTPFAKNRNSDVLMLGMW